MGAAPQVRQVRGSSTNTFFLAFVKKALSEPRSQSPCQGCIKVRITLVVSKNQNTYSQQMKTDAEKKICIKLSSKTTLYSKLGSIVLLLRLLSFL